jgi:hypothetical protein
MKSAALAIAVVFLLLVSLMVGVQPLVEANPGPSVPSLSVLSPFPSWESCYSNASVGVKIEVLVTPNSSGGAYAPQVFYSLDNGDNVTLTNVKEGEHREQVLWYYAYVSFTASSTLYNLSEGNHTIRAYAISDGKLLSAERIFTVDSGYKSPELTLISPKKITYTTREVELIFLTTKELTSAKYLLDYHLDSNARYISINGNITLTNLANGTHKIILFADCFDEYGNGRSLYQGTSFDVSSNENTPLTGLTENADEALGQSIEPTQSPAPDPEPFPTTLAIGIVVAVAVLGVGLLVHFKKSKSETKNP